VQLDADTASDVPLSGSAVHGSDGVRATIDDPAMVEGKIALRFANGQRVLLDPVAASLWRAEDGSYGMRIALGSLVGAMANSRESQVTIPVLEDVVEVTSREVETGRVRVSTHVEQYERAIDASAWVEEVAVQRVPVNRVVNPAGPPKMREEGDTLIIPVLEETLVLEKKLLLREEVRLTRTRRELRRREQIPLRREYAVIERLPPSAQISATEPEADQLRGGQDTAAIQPDRRLTMATTTFVAVFDNYSDAQNAKTDLATTGIPDSDVRITTNESSGASLEHVGERSAEADDGASFGERVAHFFRSLFGSDDDEEHVGHYSEAVRRGSCVLTVVVRDDVAQADTVTDILRRHDAIDIEDRAEQWRTQGWTGYDPAAAPLTAEQLEQERQYSQRPVVEAGSDAATTVGAAMDPARDITATGSAATGTATTGQETTLPVIEEELKVGKREVRSGGVRVFTRTTERPVEEQVTLREERATVERRPVDRPVSAADAAGFQDKTIEVRETVEEPVVSKTARVVEEVVVGKDVRERTETVADVVRRTDVEIERLGADEEDDVQRARTNIGGDSDKPGLNPGRNS